MSSAIWNIQKEDVANVNQPHLEIFLEQRSKILQEHSKEEYYILPLGIDYANKVELGVFNGKKVNDDIFNDDKIMELITLIKNKFQYIYIPKDIDPSTFTKLEKTEIQTLMGESLHDIIERKVTSSTVQGINRELKSFLDELEKELVSYSFRTNTERQQNLKKFDIYNLIIESYFSTRNLHKKNNTHWIPINDLSSGEKQKAIIDITGSLIINHRKESDCLIVAVDEPESSLHMSACFDQFMKLSEISNNCRQFLFTTHWYGFLPIIEHGSVTAITKKDADHKFDLINLANYREMLKQQARSTNGKLPYDIRLKSMNDFIQSIISSMLDEKPYNWIICEGSSEKIYFESFFKDLIEKEKLRIIPVGGITEVKKIYEYLVVAIEEFKNELNGKIAFIVDTDAEQVRFETLETDNIMIKRLINTNNKTKLLKINSNPISPATEIEDVLNGKIFYEVLKFYKPQYNELLEFVDESVIKDEIPSFYAMDLSISKKQQLTDFFDSDNIKFDFSKKYVEFKEANKQYKIPEWVTIISDFFKKNK